MRLGWWAVELAGWLMVAVGWVRMVVRVRLGQGRGGEVLHTHLPFSPASQFGFILFFLAVIRMIVFDLLLGYF